MDQTLTELDTLIARLKAAEGTEDRLLAAILSTVAAAVEGGDLRGLAIVVREFNMIQLARRRAMLDSTQN